MLNWLKRGICFLKFQNSVSAPIVSSGTVQTIQDKAPALPLGWLIKYLKAREMGNKVADVGNDVANAGKEAGKDVANAGKKALKVTKVNTRNYVLTLRQCQKGKFFKLNE